MFATGVGHDGRMKVYDNGGAVKYSPEALDWG
jgi:hypothetical protein